MKSKLWAYVKDFAAFFVGGALYAVSVAAFTAPNNIAPGGFSGLGIVASHLFGLPIGVLTLAFNIPLFIIGTRKIGFRFLGKTIVATVIMTVLIDLAEPILPAYSGDKMLASLCGGVLSGAGLALIFLRGGTTGGTDILAKLVRKKFSFIPMGRMIMILDTFIVALSALVFRNFETALYAAVVMFTSGQIIDRILYGADNGKVVMIMSPKNEEIADKILRELGRGVTFLKSQGAYSRSPADTAVCAVRRHEVSKIHLIIKEIDPGAFVIVTEAGEILGAGFKNYENKDN